MDFPFNTCLMEIIGEALRQGLASAIVVVLYLVIVKLLDERKESKQAKLNSTIVSSINNISNFIISLTKNIIDKDKEKFKIAVRDAFSSSELRLVQFVQMTIANNHVDANKDSVVANIRSIVNAEYYSVFSTLSMYVIDDKRASDVMKKEWMKEIENDVTAILYNNNITDGDKCLIFSNKISLKFQSYTAYIFNNVTV